MTVIKTAEDKFQDYVLRKFEITGIPPKSMSAKRSSLSPSFIVTQFHYLNWRDDMVPNTTAPMVEMVDKIMKVQMTTGNKAITVMCK